MSEEGGVRMIETVMVARASKFDHLIGSPNRMSESQAAHRNRADCQETSYLGLIIR